ncbi:hypothetical protein M231_00650 [Tremella mesenterica]|uniref:Tryptophan 2,3-dioxygenase n=1 Tax=Tremella mesenterica TaxID=5217 RepID=A0A4Q1BUW7_TREME|nr:hypothetical protein M231_00650 [Tremella mesenterica]
MLPQRSPSPIPTHRISLPPGHFLSLPPSYADQTPSYPSGIPSTSAHTSQGLAPNVASLASADFEVDVRTGFLPAERNVDRLPVEWDLWEEALRAARGEDVGDGLRLGGGREREALWRKGIESMPILSTTNLRISLPLLRRAHVVLAFLLHFYVHTFPSPTPRQTPLPIPASISNPLLTVSSLLGLPPILTYADTVLYNFHSLDPSLPPALPSNPPKTALASFTNTRSEEQFYIISALCEIAGAEALRLMRQSLDELFLADELALRRLTVYLRKLARQIDRIADVTSSMIGEIVPEEFYHLIRPWFRGGDADGPDSQGWLFGSSDQDLITWEAENKAGRGKKGKLFSGPSAGQSSLIHAIDIFLTVDHRQRSSPRGPQPDVQHTDEISTSSTETNGDSPAAMRITLDHTPISDAKSQPTEATFVERMLQYMPLQHRTFLLHLSTNPTPLRSVVVAHAESHPQLADAYDTALEALKGFRERHMRVVSVFIVQQARRTPSERVRRLLGQMDSISEYDPSSVIDNKLNVSQELVRGEIKEDGELRGTGGTALFKFLKMCRDDTTRAMVSRSAGKLYDLEKGE